MGLSTKAEHAAERSHRKVGCAIRQIQHRYLLVKIGKHNGRLSDAWPLFPRYTLFLSMYFVHPAVKQVFSERLAIRTSLLPPVTIVNKILDNSRAGGPAQNVLLLFEEKLFA